MKTIYSRLALLFVLGLSASSAIAQSRPRSATAPPATRVLNARTLAVAEKKAEPVTEPVVVAEPVAPVTAPVAAPQPRTLMGTVLNEQGAPLAGAVVLITSDRSSATSTNAEGQYVIHSTATEPVLKVTYAGYKDVEFTPREEQPVTFTLEPISDYARQFKKQNKAIQKAYKR